MSRHVFAAVVLLMLAAPFTHAQQLTPVALKAVLTEIPKLKQDTLLVDAYLKLAQHYGSRPFGPGRLDTCLIYCEKACKLSKALGDVPGEGTAYSWMSNAYRNKGDLTRGREMLEKARALYEKNNTTRQLISVYVMMGFNWADVFGDKDYVGKALRLSREHNFKDMEQQVLIYLAEMSDTQSNYVASRDNRLKALELSAGTNIPYSADQYSKLGYVCAQLGDYENGVTYGLKAVQMSEAENDTSFTMANRYNYLGTTYYSLRQVDEALKYFKKGVRVARSYPGYLNYHAMIRNVTLALIGQKKYAEALAYVNEYNGRRPPVRPYDQQLMASVYMQLYVKLGDLDKARHYYDELMRLMKETPIRRALLAAPIIQYYIATGQYELAREKINDSEAFFRQEKLVQDVGSMYNLRFQLDSSRGNYLEAIHNFRRFKELNDSLLDERRTKQIHELEVRYETQKKDQSIVNLRQQAELQQAINTQKDKSLKLRDQDILLLRRQHELQQALSARKDQDLKLASQQQQLQQALTQKSQQNIELLTNQAQLQEARLQQAMLMRNITVAGLLLLGVVIGLLFNRYKIKQRNSQKISAQNASLQQLVSEKEWLLKEVHHRVKNNLQTILSLLESQSHYLSNDALFAIQDSQNRVYAMSLMHQKLYQSEDVASVNIEVYIHELVQHLRDSFNVARTIQFQLAIDSVELDVSQAVPLGLIVNEAITNAIKYAFVHTTGTPQKISITLCQDSETRITLTLADNGSGLPAGFDSESKHKGLGLTLMRGLTDDIEGSFSIHSNGGVVITIVFAPSKPLNKMKQPALLEANP